MIQVVLNHNSMCVRLITTTATHQASTSIKKRPLTKRAICMQVYNAPLPFLVQFPSFPRKSVLLLVAITLG